MTENKAQSIARNATNIATTFRRVAELDPDGVALRTVDDSTRLTWREFRDRVDATAGGLSKLGLSKGDTVALMLTNRPEFQVCDMAAVTLGAVPFSIYQTSAPEQIEYVVSDAAARVAIVEESFLERFQAARANLPSIEHLIVIDKPSDGDLRGIDEIQAEGADFDAEARCAEIHGDDMLTLIYTSGTTGPPKGVQVTHANAMHAINGLSSLFELPPAARVISWLPTAHIAERMLNYYMPTALGATVTTCPNPREIGAYLTAVKPHFFFAVPRIWEKMKAGLEAQLAGQPDEQRSVVEAALAAALERVHLQQADKPVPQELEETVAAADRDIFGLIRGLVGLDETLFAGVGAAPTPRDVLEFFHAIGIELAEGWGMSETSGVGTAVGPGAVRIGSVGKALPGVELRLAEDGELLMRGPVVMSGYRNKPDKTAETIDAEGWLATGDIAEIDAEGYVKIVDRKKELIINAAGKNMSPANIESTMKGASPLIGQICVIGDARPYNTALIVLDADYGPAWAEKNGVGGLSFAELAGNDAVRGAVQAAIDAGNAKLARVEQIKKFTLLPNEWMPGADELTPTMKLKRKPIAEKYAAEIEAMYA